MGWRPRSKSAPERVTHAEVTRHSDQVPSAAWLKMSDTRKNAKIVLDYSELTEHILAISEVSGNMAFFSSVLICYHCTHIDSFFLNRLVIDPKHPCHDLYREADPGYSLIYA